MKTISLGLLAGMRIDQLVNRMNSAPYQDIWVRMNCAWKSGAARDASMDEYFVNGGLGWHSVTIGVVEAALAWRLAEDAQGLAYVERCIGYLSELCEGTPESLASIPTNLHNPVHSYREVALAADICREDLAAETRDTLCRIMREHVIPFADFNRSLTGYSCGGNISLCKNLSIGIVAMTWGEACGSSDWEEVIAQSVNVCLQYIRRGIDDCGNSYEGVGYEQEVFQLLHLFAQVLYQTGRGNLFAREPKFRQMALATLRILQPSHQRCFNIGDVGSRNPPSLPWLLLTAKHYADPVIQGFWMEFQGPDNPERPFGLPANWTAEGELYLAQLQPLLYAFLYWDEKTPWVPIESCGLPTMDYAPGTEIVNFRTGWGKDAFHVNVLGSGHGHVSYTHYHADNGHFSIYAHGEYLAIDTGRYNWSEDQHSVVLVDGLTREGQKDVEGWNMSFRSGRCKTFRSDDIVGYACVDCAHIKDAVWADRHFLFVPTGDGDGYFVVLDNMNKDNAHHSYLWQLQAHPASTVTITGERTAEVRGQEARLDFFFAIPSPEDYPDAPHTLTLRTDEKWWTWPYGKDVDLSTEDLTTFNTTSHRRPRLLAELAGVNGVMASVVTPRKKDAAPLAVRQINEKRLLRLEIDCGSFIDTVIAAPDHGYIETNDGISARSELILIRRNKGSDTTLTWTLENGALVTNKG